MTLKTEHSSDKIGIKLHTSVMFQNNSLDVLKIDACLISIYVYLARIT